MSAQGLIKSPTLAYYYSRALDSKSREDSTKHLMQTLFNDLDSPLRVPRGFSCLSEYYPSSKSQERCDLAITIICAQPSGSEVVLLFLECKRGDKMGFGKIQDLEDQVQRYAIEHLKYKQQAFVYCGTAIGTRMRLFKYEKGKPSMGNFWSAPDGENSRADIRAYKDVGDDADAKVIKSVWDAMVKSAPVPQVYHNVQQSIAPAGITAGPSVSSAITAKPPPTRVNAEPYEAADGTMWLKWELNGKKQESRVDEWESTPIETGFFWLHRAKNLYFKKLRSTS